MERQVRTGSSPARTARPSCRAIPSSSRGAAEWRGRRLRASCSCVGWRAGGCSANEPIYFPPPSARGRAAATTSRPPLAVSIDLALPPAQRARRPALRERERPPHGRRALAARGQRGALAALHDHQPGRSARPAPAWRSTGPASSPATTRRRCAPPLAWTPRRTRSRAGAHPADAHAVQPGRGLPGHGAGGRLRGGGARPGRHRPLRGRPRRGADQPLGGQPHWPGDGAGRSTCGRRFFRLQVGFSAGQPHAARVPAARARRGPASCCASRAMPSTPSRPAYMPPWCRPRDPCRHGGAGAAALAPALLAAPRRARPGDGRAGPRPIPIPTSSPAACSSRRRRARPCSWARPARALGPGAALGVRVGYDLTRWAGAGPARRRLQPRHRLRPAPRSRASCCSSCRGRRAAAERAPAASGRSSASAAGGMGRFSTNLLGTTGLARPDAAPHPALRRQLGRRLPHRQPALLLRASAGFAKLTRIATTGVMGSALYLRYTF